MGFLFSILIKYWSSTPYAAYYGAAWGLYMDDGWVANPAKSKSGYVWPVRGGN